MNASATNSVIDAIIAASGLSPVFARGAISRALNRAGIDPNTMSRRDIKRALPAIANALKVFLAETELDARLKDIDRLAG